MLYLKDTNVCMKYTLEELINRIIITIINAIVPSINQCQKSVLKSKVKYITHKPVLAYLMSHHKISSIHKKEMYTLDNRQVYKSRVSTILQYVSIRTHWGAALTDDIKP